MSDTSFTAEEKRILIAAAVTGFVFGVWQGSIAGGIWMGIVSMEWFEYHRNMSRKP